MLSTDYYYTHTTHFSCYLKILAWMPSSRFSKITFMSAANSLNMKKYSPTHHGCNHGDVSTMVAWNHTKMMP